jgi:LPPG:FO 2-phospho-L-lactate transferase
MSVVAISGGVGGAKLALGLYRVLPKHSLTIIVNTGDDFDHFSLRICPDIDTMLYTLAGLEHQEQGWGRRDETWSLMRTLGSLGEETWFNLGDSDTAMHIVRTDRLRRGDALSRIVRELSTRLEITATILPMTDDRVETRIRTDEGELAFQDYFVRRRCAPRVSEIRFEGSANAVLCPGIVEIFRAPSLEAIILCPSNPYLSIDPLLSVCGLRDALIARQVPAIAVCPLIGGDAVKGPTAKLMREFGLTPSPTTIAAHYRGLIDALVIDTSDSAFAADIDVPVYETGILMRNLEDRMRLAKFVLECARTIRQDKS